MNMFGIPYGSIDAAIAAPTALPGSGQVISPGVIPPTAQPAQAPGAFVWGASGQRMTPAEIATQRRSAMLRMQSDYSPVQSPWQGLARVANNVTGALDMRAADRAAAANASASASIAQSLANPDTVSAAPVIGSSPVAKSGDRGLFGLLGKIF